MKSNIICCGNIAFDLIFSARDGKNGESFHSSPGGSVLNTAIILSRLGMTVSMISKTGDDFLGSSLIEAIQKEKINTDNIIQDKNIRTGLAIAHLDGKGNSSYTFYKTQGPVTALSPRQRSPSLFKNASILHTGSTFSYDDYSFEGTLRLLRSAKQHGVCTSYDPNWRKGRIVDVKKARKRINRLIPHVDLLKLSKTDATGITGAKTLSGALKRLPGGIVVTLAEKGSFFWDGRRKISQSAFKVKVTDTIGAGDAFTAGLICRYSLQDKKDSWGIQKEDLTFASAASALVCRGRGASEGLKSIRQVRNFIKKHSRRF